MTIDPMELDPLDQASPRQTQLDVIVRGRAGIVSRELRVDAAASGRRLSPAHPSVDPLVLFERIATACRVGCFGPPAPAHVALARTEGATPVRITGGLTLGPTHPAALRALGRMAHGLDLGRVHVVEIADAAELVELGGLSDLPPQRPSFLVEGRESLEADTHAVEVACADSNSLLASAREVFDAWSSLLESGAFRGDNAPWSSGFLVELARAGTRSLVATFESFNVHESAFDPLILALSQLPAGASIRALNLA
jgi:hypothetical protein